MQLATAKNIVLDADARAIALDRAGMPQALGPVYETTLVTLRYALADEEPLPAWGRVAALLCDTRRRLIIDALDALPADQMRRRMSCIADLPEVAAFNSLEELSALVAAVVNVGSPRYNSGDIRGCAALYWVTIHLIAETPAVRGIPGYARAMAQIKPILDLEAPAGPFTTSATDAFAWELRHVIDAVARVTS